VNEFIAIWKTLDKEHLSKPFKLGDYNLEFPTANNGKGWELPVTHISESEEVTAVPYIGKTDIEGNKIYADFSIVEVKLKDYAILKFNPNKFIGYFSYNEKTLRYLFHADDKIHGWGADFLNHLEYIKIIGTLQENKELLDDK